MVSAEGMPSASNINGLNCQTTLTALVDPQRLFPALSTLIDGPHQIGIAPGLFPTRRHAEAVAIREARHAIP
jgi:hypothetical protein